MEKGFLIALCIFIIAKCLNGLPTVTESSNTQNEDDDFDDEIYMLSYKKYLKEVMTLLMTDERFRSKIMTEGKGLADKAKEFSMNLEFISQNIRSRLDELKRKELDRLRNLMKLKTILKQSLRNLTKGEYDLNIFEKEKLLAHLDYLNVNTFEAADLEKLIVQTSKDLEEIDRKRKDAFKVYEMEKELEKRRMLDRLDGKKREEEEKRILMMEEKHKDHPKMHHPGNEAHLLDIWEKVDGLDKKDFDPKTFFHLRDVNGDGLWDHNEVEALFQNELDKVYDKNAPEDDLVERYEEMNRMREHFVSEADNNTDGVISLREFISYSTKDEFQSDEEWKAIDGKAVFDENDLKVHKVKLEKLKLQSREGINEELSVEIGVLGNSSLAEALPNEKQQLKSQSDRQVMDRQQIVKGDQAPVSISEGLQVNQIKQLQQDEQPIQQPKAEN